MTTEITTYWCNIWTALGMFIICGGFNIKEVEFTYMATWHYCKAACVYITDMLLKDFLNYKF